MPVPYEERKIMELLNWILAIFLAGFAGLHYLKVRQMERRLILSVAEVNDLTFKFNEMVKFLENQIARAHYDQLKRTGQRVFHEETQVDEAISHPGVRDILLDRKLLKRKASGPFEKSLAEQAREASVSLEPILVALNDLEASR